MSGDAQNVCAITIVGTVLKAFNSLPSALTIQAIEDVSVFLFALVTWRPYCPGRPKKLCFTTPSLVPMVFTARLAVVKQSFFGLPGQYGRHVARANSLI